MSEGLSLNLSGAKEMRFEPVEAGWYDATIFEASVVMTENPEGNLPVGTPGINVQFKLDPNDERTGGMDRRVFRRYYIAPEGYAKKEQLDGMMFAFLRDAGYEEDELRKKSFKLEPEDLQGRQVRVKLSIRPENKEKGYDAQNEVKATKPVGEGAESDNALGSLV